METLRHVLICGECPLPGRNGIHARLWAAVRCPTCQHFYCRNASCLKRIDVKEGDHRVSCGHCGTPHHYSGRGFGKISIDSPLAGFTCE